MDRKWLRDIALRQKVKYQNAVSIMNTGQRVISILVMVVEVNCGKTMLMSCSIEIR